MYSHEGTPPPPSVAATTLPSVEPLPTPLTVGSRFSSSMENLSHRPPTAYELAPELDAQRRNVGFPFTPYHSAYTPYAPYRNLYQPVDKRVIGELLRDASPMPLDKERQRQLEVKQQKRQLKQQQMFDRQKVPADRRRRVVRFRGDTKHSCYY